MKTKTIILIVFYFSLGLTEIYAQEKTISGVVTSAVNQLPIPGVNVVVKGTTKGVQTDFDGNYSILANKGDVITFSYVGFNRTDIVVGNKTTINIQMSESTSELEEVIVMGYTTTTKKELTGAVVQIKSDQIEQIPVASVDQVLQGKVAGLSVSNTSGTPGSTTDIRIRGISSITAGNEPLYVIDGVPVTNGDVGVTTSGSALSALASINSNDIESISVLKDASATAAYGARGVNGVIVIKTKSGKFGKTKFNFNSTIGFSNDATNGPSVLTGAEREELFYDAIFNSYGASEGFTRAQAKTFYLANIESELGFTSAYRDWNQAGRPETDWADVITNRDALMMSYNFSASGGDESQNFYTSFGYLNQEATVIGSEFERISGTLNFKKDFTNSLTFNSTNSAAHSVQDGLLENSAYFSSPRTAKFFIPSIDTPYDSDGNINLNISLPNPLWIAKEDIDESKLTRILTNNALTWKTPIENLTFNSRATIDYQVFNYKRYRNRISGDGRGRNGYGWQTNRNRANYVFQNSFDYTFKLEEAHQFDIKLLQEFQKNRLYYLSAEADNFADDGLTNLDSAPNPVDANSEFSDWIVASYLAMVHYSAFDGTYVVDATYRREGNSRFANDNRWGNFWSLGAAWNIHQMQFLENNNVVSNLKIKASYGITGNALIDLNQYQSLLNYDAGYGGQGGSYPSTVGNENLSWETSETLDLGLDFGLLQNRITASLAYYQRETKDMLLDVPLSQTTGVRGLVNSSVEQTRNIGRMGNKGFEAELTIEIIRSEDINLSFGGNIATNENEVLELATDQNGEEITITDQTTRVASGHPVRGWYMPTWAGVDPANGDELWYVDGAGSTTTNNFNEANQVWQGGNFLPTLTGGVNIHFDIEGFYMDASAYYAGGHKVYEGWHRYTNGTDRYSVDSFQGISDLTDRWQKPGDTGTRYGKFEYVYRPWQRHSKHLFDGDFIRVKDITIGYKFEMKYLELIGLDGAKVFLRGTNLFTWVKDDYLQYDPEIDYGRRGGQDGGFTRLRTPSSKSIIFGLNLNF